MAGINKVILIGNLGRDPELRYTQQNNAVATLSVATTRKVKRDEQWVEETEWHRVTLWGKDAENAQKYLAKGRQVYVEGRLQTRKYEDKDGVTKYQTDVVAETVQYLGGRGGEAGAGGGDDMDQSNWGGQSQRGASRGGGSGGRGGQRRPADDGGQQGGFEPYSQADAAEDDIPFVYCE